MSRPLCSCCQSRPVAINYYKGDRVYYRKKCEVCTRNKDSAGVPRWYQHGYRIKPICDKCGFRSKYIEQFNVYHIDGNLNNCRFSNLKTVCANCQRVLHKEGIIWKQGDLRPDF